MDRTSRRRFFELAFVAAAILFTAQPAAAQQSLEARFLSACDGAVQRNTPLYTAEQRREICACRYDYVADDLSPAEMQALIALFDGRGQDILDTPPAVDQARIDSYEACIPY